MPQDHGGIPSFDQGELQVHFLGMTLTGVIPERFPPKRHVQQLRFFFFQLIFRSRHIGSGDPICSLTQTVTIHNLPDEVLLEIFNFYRQTFGDQLRVWNNRNGWFKLAHVCQNWRSVVLASPSKLQLRLYFAANSPTSAVALDHLSHLPIIVDFSKVTWYASAQKRLISALRYPDRVCSIAIRGSQKRRNAEKIIEALDLPFPVLESLELDDMTGVGHILLASSFMASIQSLRHLRLFGSWPLPSILPLLSVTTALVDLTLRADRVFCPTTGASLLTYLQYLPHLRNLQVTTFMYLYPPTTIEKPLIATVLLAELTCFRFIGECAEMDWFVAGLVLPSLREFRISITDNSDVLRIPNLFEFIRVAGISFFGAQLAITSFLRISLFAHPHSIDDTPSKIVTIKTQLASDPGSALSAMLTTLEDVFLFYEKSPFGLVPWRKFFKEFHGVKVLRLHHGLETQVAEMLRQPPVIPSPLQ